MNKTTKIAAKCLVIVFDILVGVGVFYLFFNLTWFFAHSIMDGGIVGNDSPFALSMIRWFSSWWPLVPKWFPLQGTGVSMFYSYPMFPTYLIIVLSKITWLNDAQIYRLLSFLIFPITSLGIYFLTKRVTKSRAAGFVAGIFFLVSEASWVFLRLHGIFAQTFSMIFFPFTVLFFDKAVEGFLSDGNNSIATRLNWIIGSLLLALCFLAHPVTGVVTTGVLFAYILLTYVLLPLFKKIKTERNNFMVLIPLTIFIGMGIGIASFWLLPFYSYSSLANRDGLNSMGMDQLKEVSLLPQTLLGFHDLADDNLRYDYFFFALPVLLLFGLGVVMGIIKNKKLLAMAILAILSLLYTSLPLYLDFLVKPFRYLFTAVYFRALVAPFIFLPLVAAGGVGLFWNLLLGWWTKFVKNKYLSVFSRISVGVVAGGITILTAYFMIINFVHRPPDNATKNSHAYGIDSFEAYGPTLDKDWKSLLTNPSLLLWPHNLEINNARDYYSQAFKATVEDLSLGQFDRIDVSPNVLGGAVVKNDGVETTKASIINLYHYFASLNHSMWGYQAGVFFGHEPIYDNSKLLEELTKWYGVKYVYNLDGWDRIDNYKNVGYELVKKYGDGSSSFNVYTYPNSPGMVELGNKPTVLVIGDTKTGGYEQVFRSANMGVLPYDSAILVEGRDRVDAYSLKELQRFDGLILHGYSYKSKTAAWRLINNYLTNGGKVFVNTGWQYTSKDWGNTSKESFNLPDPNPVRLTDWKNLDDQEAGTVSIDTQYKGNYQLSDFSPFLWRGSPWGMAVSQRKNLRDGAQPVMWVGDNILMASQKVGKGEIVWSGFNIFSHIQEYRNIAEADFLFNVFSQLFTLKTNYPNQKVAVSRVNPDTVKFNLSQTGSDYKWLLWKESYSPDWKMIGDKGTRISLYRAGPGFILAYLPSSLKDKELTLDYKLSFFEGTLASVISIASIIFLAAYLCTGKRMGEVATKYLGSNLGPRFKKVFKSAGLSGGEDY